jgi:4-oxalocrotonate tautomerase
MYASLRNVFCYRLPNASARAFPPGVRIMPVVTIRMSKGRTKEQKQTLVEEITGTIVRTLSVDPDWVTILIEELDRENIARAGNLLE